MIRLPSAFVPAVTPGATTNGAVLWFAFRRRELLVTEHNQAPEAASLESLGVAPRRVQFLGELNGQPCFSAELPPDSTEPPGLRFRDLRQLFGRLSDDQMGLAARAVQIVDWDRNHQFCGACGSPTGPHPTQRARVCSAPDCGLPSYPRLAPAMIVAVERGEEILLGRSPHFPPGIYSVLAGFLDPGESAEDAVRREVREETGIQVANVRYFGSQPWPFPNSLMLGFQADYAGGEVAADPDELEDAAFFHVDALPPMFPGRVSISQWLVHDFLRRHRPA